MGRIQTTLRINAMQPAKSVQYLPGAVSATNVQDAIDTVQTNLNALAASAPTKPANLTQVAVNAAMSPYTAQSTDYVLFVDTTAGPVTILLGPSAARANLEIEIKDVGGAANTNAITVTPNGAEKIDNLSSYPIDSKYAGAIMQPRATGGFTVKP